MQAPERLVIWEAQYGDFINGAQTVVDEFLVSARSKWGIEAPTVLLLPHGYEGQGPDHSSGRPERFLSLAVGDNLWAVNVTTAAQYFHVLRLQAARLKAREASPLILFSPKGLLRHPLALSTPRELAEDEFRPVLPERADPESSEVRRLILVTGRVFADLEEGRRANPWISVVRLERIHPLPEEELTRLFASYPGLEEVIWLQEEPENMGAWSFVRSGLERAIPKGVGLAYVGRQPSASPAEGSHASHKRRQQEIVRQALSVGAVHREVSIHGR
jgi:2-oxoglutarate dehydrogenase E1 component